jgi:hypothetical protein
MNINYSTAGGNWKSYAIRSVLAQGPDFAVLVDELDRRLRLEGRELYSISRNGHFRRISYNASIN